MQMSVSSAADEVKQNKADENSFFYMLYEKVQTNQICLTYNSGMYTNMIAFMDHFCCWEKFSDILENQFNF